MQGEGVRLCYKLHQMKFYSLLYLNSTERLNSSSRGVLLIYSPLPVKKFYYLFFQTVNTKLNLKLLEAWSCFQVRKTLGT